MTTANEAISQDATPSQHNGEAVRDADLSALLQVLQVTVRTHDAYRHETDQASALAAWSESVALARAAIKAAYAEKGDPAQSAE